MSNNIFIPPPKIIVDMIPSPRVILIHRQALPETKRSITYMDTNTLAGTMENDELIAERFDRAFADWKQAERRLAATRRRLIGRRRGDILKIAPGRSWDIAVTAVGLALTVAYCFGGF